MISFEKALQETRETGAVMLGFAYVPREHQVTIFEIRRAGETEAIRFSRGVLFSGQSETGEMSKDERILAFTKFKPLIGDADLISMPVELAAYTYFLGQLPHPYEHDHQGYQGHFTGILASIV
ncbi:hypothetical protein F3I62_18845 [Pseudomonas sp. R-28-1W-6]|uniref:hypothetical protein n=1 Tax=Pseudomonas sp. R-28-1W-6 TaxID=2650101 RepID=UPI00136646CB|nr:hypothetical protein [Pseudomonas sp. R-28-1W-6]MWV14163.1 hypothetical protein [Pseudomonas sp. R-28-1W-6]